MGILSEKIQGKIINVDIQSTNLKFASYDTETKTLTITFANNSVYEYYDVNWEIFTKFRLSESQGKYFNSTIKNGYKFKKVS